MIKSFNHKGLELFFQTGSVRGIQAAYSQKLNLIFATLEAAQTPFDMNIQGWNLHKLHGNLSDLWSVKVSANWRVTFRFINSDAYVADYQDYH